MLPRKLLRKLPRTRQLERLERDDGGGYGARRTKSGSGHRDCCPLTRRGESFRKSRLNRCLNRNAGTGKWFGFHARERVDQFLQRPILDQTVLDVAHGAKAKRNRGRARGLRAARRNRS
jgi:hypothetical protein